MSKTWWLVIRRRPGLEAIGIAEYVEPEKYGPGTDYISKADHWIATMHDRLSKQIGPEWMWEVISRAEFETFRDLHGLRVLGE